MARFIILLLSVFHVDATLLIISKPGSNVSVNCRCFRTGGCVLDYMRWVRFHMNGTVEVINTTCQKPPCRFSSVKLNATETQLTILRVEERDSGRYYCGERMSALIDFKAEDTLLHVGEEEVWTKNSKVELFFEWFNNSIEDQPAKRRRYAELRCLVSGLSAPVVNIFWRSSGGKNQTGQILELMETNSGFQVMSQLHIPTPTSNQSYYNNLDHDQKRDSHHYNSHNAGQHEYNITDLEEGEWWCEFHAGDKVYKSNTFLLNKRNGENGEESGSEWCAALSYAAIALSTVCVILLLILISHWLCRLHTGSKFQAEAQDNEQPEVTYTDLHFKQSSKSKSGRRHQHVRTQEDASLYSQVKCSGSSTSNGSPLTDTQVDEQPGVTYTHLNFKQQSKSKSGRRHKERRLNGQDETSLYSQVKTK